MKLRWLNFPFQPNINVETTLNQRNSIKAVSTLFCQRWNNVAKHAPVQLSFSTKFQCWNNFGSSTLNRRNSVNVVPMLFCQPWNNVDKCTSAQLSFSTKYQRWNNVDERWGSMLFQRWFNVDVFAGMNVIAWKSKLKQQVRIKKKMHLRRKEKRNWKKQAPQPIK